MGQKPQKTKKVAQEKKKQFWIQYCVCDLQKDI